ncbi:hypothetical protein ABG067_007945 [Albugo candida]
MPTIPTVTTSTFVPTSRTPSSRNNNAAREEARLKEIEDNIALLMQERSMMRTINPARYAGRNSALAVYKNMGEKFDMTTSICKSEHNTRVFRNIELLAFKTQYFKDYLLEGDTTLYKNTLLEKNTHKVIRNHFEYKQKLEKRKDIPVEVVTASRLKNKLYGRIKRKLDYRTTAFMLNEEVVTQEFGTKEECSALLKKEFMSDDEDDELVNGDVAVTIVTKRPAWRSDKILLESGQLAQQFLLGREVGYPLGVSTMVIN